jgi:hypothetical protein
VAGEHAAVLELAERAAGAGVVAVELFGQFLLAVDDADAALDVRLGRVALTPFAGRLEIRKRRSVR